MALLGLLLVITMAIRGHLALTVQECGTHARRPEYTDISVVCGTSSIELAIQMCPVVYTGYNESLLILNHIYNQDTCRGTLDTSVTPPVVRFSFPLLHADACGSIFMTTSAPGTGVFSDFSNIQTVNVSGIVRSYDPTVGTVTYNAELKYLYSCAYPLEYFINNTQVDVSSSSIAVKDNNGSFISTLRMELFSDPKYSRPLRIPPLGLELRKNIYVQVIATNLTSQYYVLLDRCYASISPHPSNSTFFNLFVPCSVDPMTSILENGEGQKARFLFPAFRFVEQQNQTVSTYYLHCITRLCEISTCSYFKLCVNENGRRRRNAEDTTTVQDGLSGPTLITSAPIITNNENPGTTKDDGWSGSSSRSTSSTVGLGVTVGVLVLVGAVALMVAITFYRRLRRMH